MNKTALIDWLSFSIPQEFSWDNASRTSVHPIFKHLFGIEPPIGYTKVESDRWYRERHTVFSSSGHPMLHISLRPTTENNSNTSVFTVTGHGLSDDQYDLNVDAVELIKKIDLVGGKLTRPDLALDIRGGGSVLKKMHAASLPTVWKDNIITPLRFDKPRAYGFGVETVSYGQLGKKGSMICAYDKALETGTPGPWERIEFRTRNPDICAAIQAAVVANQPLGEITADLLMQYLKFLTPGSKSKYNRPVASWWSDALQDGSGFEFNRHAGGKNEEPARRKQSLPTVIAYLKAAFKNDDGSLEEGVLEFLDLRRSLAMSQ